MVEVAAVAMDARAHGIGRLGAPEHGADALRLPQWDTGPRLSQLRGVGGGARADLGGQGAPPAPGKAQPSAAQPGGARPPGADGACAAPAAAASDGAPAGEPAGVPVFVMLPLDTVRPLQQALCRVLPEAVHSSSTMACGHCARVYRSLPAPGCAARAPGPPAPQWGLCCSGGPASAPVRPQRGGSAAAPIVTHAHRAPPPQLRPGSDPPPGVLSTGPAHARR